MTAGKLHDSARGEQTSCKGVILYEDESALQRANDLCDQLLNKQWLEVDLQFDHWLMTDLVRPHGGQRALEAAADADIVVIAAPATGEFTPEIQTWLERWAMERGGREGALVGLFAAETGQHVIGGSRDRLLHRLALTAGMDYLNQLPLEAVHRLPDEPDWCNSRAQTMTGTLDGILRTEPQPRLD